MCVCVCVSPMPYSPLLRCVDGVLVAGVEVEAALYVAQEALGHVLGVPDLVQVPGEGAVAGGGQRAARRLRPH